MNACESCGTYGEVYFNVGTVENPCYQLTSCRNCFGSGYQLGDKYAKKRTCDPKAALEAAVEAVREFVKPRRRSSHE